MWQDEIDLKLLSEKLQKKDAVNEVALYTFVK